MDDVFDGVVVEGLFGWYYGHVEGVDEELDVGV